MNRLDAEGLARLDAALAYIDAHPQEWEQDVWVCETGGCVAGHLVHLDSTTDWPTLVLSGGIEGRAADLLVLSMDQCEGLFSPDNTRAALTVWRQILAGQRVVAPGADLTRIRLSGADLPGADLTRASMEYARLIGTNLAGADLTDADLQYADLRGADLRGADLTHVDLRYVDLRGAFLDGADLTGADLTGADLAGAWMPDGQPQHA
jgi:uncharacterized protein YjbI with pentapeptide repeats